VYINEDQWNINSEGKKWGCPSRLEMRLSSVEVEVQRWGTGETDKRQNHSHLSLHLRSSDGSLNTYNLYSRDTFIILDMSEISKRHQDNQSQRKGLSNSWEAPSSPPTEQKIWSWANREIIEEVSSVHLRLFESRNCKRLFSAPDFKLFRLIKGESQTEPTNSSSGETTR
jgi:hypothetical protein